MPYDPRLAMLLDMLEAQQYQNVPKYGKGGKVLNLLLGPASTASTKSRRKVLGLDTKVPETAPTSMLPEIPMSRRDVLRMGAGQAARGLIPQGALSSLKSLAGEGVPQEIVEQVMQQSVKGGSRSPTVLGAVARALYQGLEDDEVVRQVTKQFGKSVDENVLYDTVIPSMRDPWDALDVTEETWDPLAEAFAEGPLAYLRRSLGDPKPNELRASLREIKEADPFTYKSLLKAARDTDMTVAELTPELTFKKRLQDAQALAEKGGYSFDMQKFLQRYGYPEN